jgi:hypothetical protein
VGECRSSIRYRLQTRQDGPAESYATDDAVPSIRGEVGSSSSDGQLRHVKIVHAGGVAAGDPRIVVRGRLGLFAPEFLERLGTGLRLAGRPEG